MKIPAKRFPILLWGDLVEDSSPILRRALAGFRAHECMYAWVYLTEHLAHRRLVDMFSDLPADLQRGLLARMDSDLWESIDRATVDPHFQVSRTMFESVAWMSCLAARSGEVAPDFVELGSTFFTSIARFDLIDRVARARFPEWPRLQPRWLGIDNSRFMHDATRALHGNAAITLSDDYRTAPKPERFAVFLSRFVASYAFARGSDFSDYLAARFQAAVVEDAYATVAEEVRVSNHGQPEVFFSIPEVFGRLEKSGFEIFLLDAYPDFPAGAAPCHVIRYLAARKGLVTEEHKVWMRDLGFVPPDGPVAAEAILQRLNDSVTPELWRAVKKAKEESPVWGRTSYEETAPAWSPLLRKVKDLARRYLVHPAWRRYRLGGPLAEREIERAVSEEKP